MTGKKRGLLQVMSIYLRGQVLRMTLLRYMDTAFFPLEGEKREETISIRNALR